MGAQAFNSITWGVWVGVSEHEGQPGLQSKSKASPGS